MKKVTGYIQIYSRKARDLIMKAGAKFLVEAGIQHLSYGLFSCVDEIIKNAVKANYKFVLIRDRIFDNIKSSYPEKTEDEINKEIHDIIKIQDSYDHIANEILANEDITGIVRQILNEEAKLLEIKNCTYIDSRECSEEENRIISSLTLLNNMRKRIRELGIKIILKIQSDYDYIYIEVTNTAPILTKDIERIHTKREDHRRYMDKGKAYEFFVDKIDTSDAGFGLGYAKIDAILSKWGLEPVRAVTIISSINTTVMLTLPKEELKRFSDI